MVEVMTPGSIWVQLGSFFFLLSGLFSDLMLIRFFLLMAYIMLTLNAGLGLPVWPDTNNPGYVAVDSLVWAAVCIFVHGAALVCLLLDEGRVRLTDDEAALWRMLYRADGLSARQFKSILSGHVNIIDVGEGQNIPIDDHFYVVYTGEVKLEVVKASTSAGGGGVSTETIGSRIAVSGAMFDLKNLTEIMCGRKILQSSELRCTALTKARLFRFCYSDMEEFAKNPLAKGVWDALVIGGLSSVVEAQQAELDGSRGADYNSAALDGDGRKTRANVFRPLEPWEEPMKVAAGSGSALRHLPGHFLHCVRTSFAPPLSHLDGIRQTGLPAPSSPSNSTLAVAGNRISTIARSTTMAEPAEMAPV